MPWLPITCLWRRCRRKCTTLQCVDVRDTSTSSDSTCIYAFHFFQLWRRLYLRGVRCTSFLFTYMCVQHMHTNRNIRYTNKYMYTHMHTHTHMLTHMHTNLPAHVHAHISTTYPYHPPSSSSSAFLFIIQLWHLPTIQQKTGPRCQGKGRCRQGGCTSKAQGGRGWRLVDKRSI